MMGGIMRPGSCWNILNLFILAMPILTIDADSDECTTEIFVRRDTVYEASPGQELRINCPVRFCNISPPTIIWLKIKENSDRVKVNSSNRIKTEWKPFKQQEGWFYLIFQNILRSDSGGYLCEGGSSVSHTITVNVNDSNKNDTSTEAPNNTNSHTPTSKETLMMYVYSAAGIGLFVVMVIIVSVICMRGCKGKSKKETENENQYMELPKIEQPTPRAPSRQPSPRGSPNPLPSRRSSEKKTQRQPGEETGNNEHLYGQTKKNRDRKINAAPSEEPTSVVYAALNHELPPRTGTRPLIQVEETEYAAIRLV